MTRIEKFTKPVPLQLIAPVGPLSLEFAVGVAMGHSQDLDYSCEHHIYKQGLILESRSGDLIHYDRTAGTE